MEQLKEEFQTWLLNRDKSHNTIKSYLKVLGYFERWYSSENNTVVNYLTMQPIDFRVFKQYLLTEKKKKDGSPLSIRTINQYLEGLKTFYIFLVETKKIDINPMEYVKLQAVKTEYPTHWLTNKEKKSFLKYTEDLQLKKKNPWKFARNKFIVFVMLHAGLRKIEVANLTIFDIKDGYLRVREGKGQAAREVPMNKSLVHAYEEWMIERKKKPVHTDFLLVSQKGGRLSEHGVFKVIKKIGHNAGLNIGPHTLRHTFGHDLTVLGHPLTYVAALLGHNDIRSTRIYTSPKRENLKDAVESLSDE